MTENQVVYTVEKDVPMLNVPRGGRPCKYPFNEMNIGDSFLVPFSDLEGLPKPRVKIWSAASYYGSRHSVKFSVHKINEEGYRVWRVL